jgi:hypothetical protein
MQSIEHAAFESPLSDEQLAELGRLVVNCGFAEFLVGQHVGMLHNVQHSSRGVLIHAIPFQRKLEILKNGLETIPGGKTRSLVKEACTLAGAAITDRNLLIHGIWGFDSENPDSKPIVGTFVKTSGVRRPADITKTANALAVASRKLKHALEVDQGGKLTDKAERLVVLP